MEPTRDFANLSAYHKLDGIEVSTATPSTTFVDNVKANVKRGIKPLSDHEWFAKIKGHNKPIGLVGGGPSIKKELNKIKEFQIAGNPIIACGSSHDWLVENNITPTFCVVCDPDPITAAYLKRHNEDTTYLIALSCDGLVFETLKDRKVYVWNCRSDEAAPHVEEEVKGHVDILGGCTVGLRSIPIAMTFGFTNLHLWGFDSCMGKGEDEHHAYKYETDQEQTGVTYPVRFGDIKEDAPDADGEYYICSGYQLAQAMHFQQFLVTYGSAFTPTFHGEGMLKDYMAYLKLKSEQTAKPNMMVQAA